MLKEVLLALLPSCITTFYEVSFIPCQPNIMKAVLASLSLAKRTKKQHKEALCRSFDCCLSRPRRRARYLVFFFFFMPARPPAIACISKTTDTNFNFLQCRR